MAETAENRDFVAQLYGLFVNGMDTFMMMTR